MSKQNIAITVDAVIICQREEPMILLVQRKNDPFKNKWALPGGFLEDEEDLEEGAKRELKEETNLKISHLKQIGAFGEPGRDPRGRNISIAFLGIVDSEEEVQGNDDAADARWFGFSKLPDLAFDHYKIVTAGIALL